MYENRAKNRIRDKKKKTVEDPSNIQKYTQKINFISFYDDNNIDKDHWRPA